MDNDIARITNHYTFEMSSVPIWKLYEETDNDVYHHMRNITIIFNQKSSEEQKIYLGQLSTIYAVLFVRRLNTLIQTEFSEILFEYRPDIYHAIIEILEIKSVDNVIPVILSEWRSILNIITQFTIKFTQLLQYTSIFCRL